MVIALKMASSKADLEAIRSDFNAYILSNSFGAKYGQAAFSMDPALVGKNHVETALRLRTFLQTSRDKALAPHGPRFFVTADDWIARCGPGVPGLIPAELGGGSRSGFNLEADVTCTQSFADQEELYLRAVHSTSDAATEPTLPSRLWFRRVLQALIRSESGHQADIYTECTIGGSAARQSEVAVGGCASSASMPAAHTVMPAARAAGGAVLASNLQKPI